MALRRLCQAKRCFGTDKHGKAKAEQTTDSIGTAMTCYARQRRCDARRGGGTAVQSIAEAAQSKATAVQCCDSQRIDLQRL
jgi:hypothetical protein